MTEFVPSDALRNVLSRWWWVVILTALGGIVGWTFHFLLPPIYEADATITVSMVFYQRDLTQIEEDFAFSNAAAVINSSAIIDMLRQDMEADGLSSAEINSLVHHLSVEARESAWELHVRDRNPEYAARYANLWADIADQALNEALRHALVTDSLQKQINGLQSCLPSATPVPPSSADSCSNYSLTEINTDIQNLSDQVVVEKSQSLGLLPTMSFSPVSPASIPETPVEYQAGSLTLAGALIGFILSLWITNIHKGPDHA